MKEARPPRREREKERQRQEMLEAALSLFAERGYHNVTMHEIAEKAEFAIGTLYKFFRNKEDLYRTLILEKMDGFNAMILKALHESQDEVEQLGLFVRTLGELLRANVPVMRLFFTETHGESFNKVAGLDAEIHKYHDQMMERLAEIFARGIRNKRFKPIADPLSLAIALDAMTSAFFFRWLENPGSQEYYEKTDTILNILFKGLLDE